MNERIRQLAEQADGVFIHKLITGAKQYTFLEKDLEKFAELIIMECMDQCYNRGMNDELYAGQLKAASYIEQHFGINTRT